MNGTRTGWVLLICDKGHATVGGNNSPPGVCWNCYPMQAQRTREPADKGRPGRTWNVETLGAAVDSITGDATAAVSWADADGAAIARAGRKRKPPQLVVGVCVRDDAVEAQIRALPGFVSLSAHDTTDPLDDEPVRILRVVFARDQMRRCS